MNSSIIQLLTSEVFQLLTEPPPRRGHPASVVGVVPFSRKLPSKRLLEVDRDALGEIVDLLQRATQITYGIRKITPEDFKILPTATVRYADLHWALYRVEPSQERLVLKVAVVSDRLLWERDSSE